ncbi:hypothetical protein [Candidatus Binatus sp.]|uniref:hypothetical protein n=1 Tax=Candidatus Binatus sp. TaxID=2811406 RepID=UPI003C73A19F
MDKPLDRTIGFDSIDKHVDSPTPRWAQAVGAFPWACLKLVHESGPIPDDLKFCLSSATPTAPAGASVVRNLYKQISASARTALISGVPISIVLTGDAFRVHCGTLRSVLHSKLISDFAFASRLVLVLVRITIRI